MRNPPDFVMYVVMVKARTKNFDPDWSSSDGYDVKFCYGFAKRSDARHVMLDYQRIYGKKNAYVQQYGPFR